MVTGPMDMIIDRKENELTVTLKPKRRSLKTVAKDIEAKLPGWKTKVERSFVNTDRKIGRLRSPGKGRYGLRLRVFNPQGHLVIDHNNAETYRSTSEVEEWLAQKVKNPKKSLPREIGYTGR
jgi:hypothetical protein